MLNNFFSYNDLRSPTFNSLQNNLYNLHIITLIPFAMLSKVSIVIDQCKNIKINNSHRKIHEIFPWHIITFKNIFDFWSYFLWRFMYIVNFLEIFSIFLIIILGISWSPRIYLLWGEGGNWMDVQIGGECNRMCERWHQTWPWKLDCVWLRRTPGWHICRIKWTDVDGDMAMTSLSGYNKGKSKNPKTTISN